MNNYIFSRKVHEETLGTVSQMNSAVSLDIIKSGPYAGAKAIPQILGGTFFLAHRLHFNMYICI